jgi:hypothetical protein
MTELTNAKLRALSPGEKPFRLGDRSISGLFLEVLPSGLKKWRLMANVMGRRRRTTLGSFPELGLSEARKAASGFLTSPKWLDRPGPEARSQKTRSFGDLARIWLEQNKSSLKSNNFKYYYSLLKSHILPSIGRQTLSDISPSTIVLELLKPLRDRGDLESANSSLKVCRMIFRLGLTQGLVTVDPTLSLPEYHAEPVTCQIVPNIDPNVDSTTEATGQVSHRMEFHQGESRSMIKSHHYQVKRNPITLTTLANTPKADSDKR